MSETRNPRKLLVTWINAPRPIGRPKETIARAYMETLTTNLGFSSSALKTWIPIAKDAKKWAHQIESQLDLKPGNYTPMRKRNFNVDGAQADEIR